MTIIIIIIRVIMKIYSIIIVICKDIFISLTNLCNTLLHLFMYDIFATIIKLCNLY